MINPIKKLTNYINQKRYTPKVHNDTKQNIDTYELGKRYQVPLGKLQIHPIHSLSHSMLTHSSV